MRSDKGVKRGGQAPWTRRAEEATAAARDVEKERSDQVMAMMQTPEGRAKLLQLVNAEKARGSFAEFFKQAWTILEPSTPISWNWHLDTMCSVAQALFVDWMKTKRVRGYVNKCRRAIFNVPPGSSKPVSVEGLVVERTHGLIKLKDVEPGQQILTHRGRFRNVKAVHEQGDLETIEFVTGRGRVICVAPDHTMLTPRGWVEARHLRVKDVLVEVHGEESCGTATVSTDEARLIGYLIGDGCLTPRGGASFTNQDLETHADFSECARSVGLDPVLRKRTKNYSGTGSHIVTLTAPKTGVCCHCKERPATRGYWCQTCRHKLDTGKIEKPEYRAEQAVRAWTDKHDLTGKNSYTKRVPAGIMSGNEEVIAHYLAAYWACDGGIHDRRDLPRSGRVNQVTNTVRIDATTVSEGLARDHQALLQRLGLRFRVRRRVSRMTAAMNGRHGRRTGENYVSWQLVASDQDTCAKFMDVIGRYIRHEKRWRVPNLVRTDVDQIRHSDEIVEVRNSGVRTCRCLTVEEDESFVYQGVAVHNSRLLSVAFQAWCWLHWPGMRWICLSVNDDAAMRDARAMRDLVRSPWYRESFDIKWKLKGDQDAVSNFGNSEGGERLSMPSRSKVVGIRGDACLIDDANDPSENEKERKEVNDNWDSTQSNRVNDMQRSLQIAVQQRTGSGDFTDHLLERQHAWSPENTGGWLHVVLPAEFDPDRRFILPEPLAEILREQVTSGLLLARDVLLEDPRKKLGEAIDENRMPTKTIDEERKKWEGTANFEAQMNQRPSSAQGSIIKREYWDWFRLEGGVRGDVDELETDRPRPAGCTLRDEHPAKLVKARHHMPGEWDFDAVVLSLDCALKKTVRGSNWGIGVFATKGGHRYWLDDRSQRGDILEIVAVLRDVIRMWRPTKILIEDKAASEDMKIRLLEEMTKGDMPMIELVMIKVGNEGKEQRLDPCISTIKNGVVSLLDGASWLNDVVEETAEFPFGRRDDRVDVLTQFLNYYMVHEETQYWPRM